MKILILEFVLKLKRQSVRRIVKLLMQSQNQKIQFKMAQQMLKEDNLDMEGINLEMEKILQQLKKDHQLDQNFFLDDNGNQVNDNLKIEKKCS